MKSERLAELAHGHKKNMAVETMRAEIVEGGYEPGSRLPTFDQLVDKFGVSRATIQHAIRQLVNEGFVHTENRGGLFVVEKPPHLHRVGVLFGTSPGSVDWSRFFAIFKEELPVLLPDGSEYEFACFYNLSAQGSSPDLAKLESEIQANRFSGLIIHRGCSFVVEHLGLRKAGIPCVMVNHTPEEAGEIPVVKTNAGMFTEKALNWFREHGRKRMAAVTIQGFYKLNATVVEKFGLETKPFWLCATGRDHQHVGNIVRLLLDYPAPRRPDALLISSDHLVDESLSAVVQAGLVIGKNIDVLAFCNWPWHTQSTLPIARLGFHTHDFIRACLKVLEDQRLGRKFESVHLVPALFEHEIAGPVHRGNPTDAGLNSDYFGI